MCLLRTKKLLAPPSRRTLVLCWTIFFCIPRIYVLLLLTYQWSHTSRSRIIYLTSHHFVEASQKTILKIAETPDEGLPISELSYLIELLHGVADVGRRVVAAAAATLVVQSVGVVGTSVLPLGKGRLQEKIV